METQPLATRMRPTTVEAFSGQQHLLQPGRPLYQALAQGHLHSMVLWGPPGVGKTTLAHLLANHCDAAFETMSAVLSGVKDIRDVMARAKKNRKEQGRATVLFVDEVHRFNKAQQDAFLPHIESGDIVFIGATTENPSFQLNNALLSRARVYILKALSEEDLLRLVNRALQDDVVLKTMPVLLDDVVKQQLVQAADGDARQALSLLELIVDFADIEGDQLRIPAEALTTVLQQSHRRFDQGGDAFFDQISALHKSVRGSDPDAALYWLTRMLDGGCDPAYVARRIVRMASEDIGNADPRGLSLAMDAWQAYERLGAPEGELMLAQAVVYLACAPKSNAVYQAFNQAMSDAQSQGSLPVPLHLRNAPTTMMKQQGFGRGYRYAHDEPDAVAVGEKYFPSEMDVRYYYQPVPRGLEIKIAERLAVLRRKD